MDWLIGTLIIALQVLFFVIVPVIAVWLIARKGHATRIVTFIITVIAVGVIAFMTGFNACQHHLSRRYYEEFIQPFTILMNHLKILSDDKEYVTLANQITSLAESRITYEVDAGNTNTLWRYVDDLKDEKTANMRLQRDAAKAPRP